MIAYMNWIAEDTMPQTVYWNCISSWLDDPEVEHMFFENQRTHRLFLDGLCPVDNEPNPLPILMRALNAVALWFPLKQPRWKPGRWKALT